MRVPRAADECNATERVGAPVRARARVSDGMVRVCVFVFCGVCNYVRGSGVVILIDVVSGVTGPKSRADVPDSMRS